METKTNYSIPIAIVIAGVIIAGAMYFGDGKKIDSPVAPVSPQAVGLDQIKLVTASSHILGSPDADITIIEYSDTECPFCQRFQVTMQSVISDYGKDGKVAWVYRHFPLDSLHKKSRKESEATECVNELGGNTAFWKMLDTIYAKTPTNDGLDPAKLSDFAGEAGVDVTKFNTCLASGKYASAVEADYQDGIKAGAQGTPYSVMVLKKALSAEAKAGINAYVVANRIYDQSGKPLIYASTNGKKIVSNGALPLEMIKSIIDIVLK